MPQFTIVIETVFLLFEETTPDEALRTIEEDLRPIEVNQGLSLDRIDFVLGVCDDEGTFEPVTADQDDEGEYSVKVIFHLNPIEAADVDEALSRTEIGHGIEVFPYIDGEDDISETVSDDVFIFDASGTRVY
jgi:hypothetical protein